MTPGEESRESEVQYHQLTVPKFDRVILLFLRDTETKFENTRTCGTLFCFPYAAVLKNVQQWGPLLLEFESFVELFAIHERESTPFTKAPSK